MTALLVSSSRSQHTQDAMALSMGHLATPTDSGGYGECHDTEECGRAAPRDYLNVLPRF